ASDPLPDQESGRGQIQRRADAHLADTGHQHTAGHTGDDAPVDGQPALTDVKDPAQVVLEEIPVKDNIVQPCPDHAGDEPGDDHIDEAVAVDTDFFGVGEGITRPEQKPDADE